MTTPDVLELYIPQKEQTLRVHVIWRHGQEVGVAFTAGRPGGPGCRAASSRATLAERVARLELEIAGLKRILKKMKTDAGPEFDVA